MARQARHWDERTIEIVVTLYRNGAPLREIGEIAGLKLEQVKYFVNRFRDDYQLPFRQKQPSASTKTRLGKGFDYEWSGGVEWGHWGITKPWKSGRG
jgi:hypothetical protein